MDFSNNIKDYLRKKEMESEAKKANRNRIIEQQNRESFLKYQDFLRSQLAGDYEIPNEPIVVDDLLLYYDAGIQTSYSGTGTSIIDITRNGRNGTIAGSPNWNSKGWFDFSNDYITTSDLDQVITAAAEDHSVEVWIYPTNNGVIVSYQGTDTPSAGYHFSAIELVSGQVEFGLWNGSAITSTGGTGALTLNAWHQVVLTYDKTTCRGYVDGELVGSVNVNFDSPMNDAEARFLMRFGISDVTSQGNGTYFDGRMAIMKVYGRALTDAEVVQNYTSHHRRFVYNG